jgi:hypothetical protein
MDILDLRRWPGFWLFCALTVLLSGAHLSYSQILTEDQKVYAADRMPFDLFGCSVALDGTTAIVGAPNGGDVTTSNEGSAYALRLNQSGNWVQTAELLPSVVTTDFGYSAALSGSTAIIGDRSRRAFVFRDNGAGVWQELAALQSNDWVFSDNFASSVSISGNTAIVGAYQKDSGKGAAYIFRETAGVWSQTAKLTASDGMANDWFGFSVDISGNTAVVGALRRDTPAAEAGSAYVFQDNGSGVWSQVDILTANDAAESDGFGAAVAIDGNLIVAGAQFKGEIQGAAYLFQRGMGGDWNQLAKLVDANGAPYDQFGASVDIDGATVVVGQNEDDAGTPGTQAAFAFRDDGLGNWVQVAKLRPSDPNPFDTFGNSVAISGDNILIGDIQDSGATTAAGAAYFYELTEPGLTGDVNNDGVFDAADYVAWRKQGDTAATYLDWVRNFGNSSGSAGAVPEPGAMAIVLVLAASALPIRRGAKKRCSR